MALKDRFLAALEILPEPGLKKFLDVPIPVMREGGDYNDVEAAIQEQGKLAANINDILKAFEGLTLIDLILRVGSHNPALQGMLLASLQVMGGAAMGKIKINLPAKGAAIPLAEGEKSIEIDIALSIEGGGEVQDVTVEVSGPDSQAVQVSSAGEGKPYTGTVLLSEPGDYSLSATATFKEGEGDAITASSSFSVTVPAPAPESPEGE